MCPIDPPRGGTEVLYVEDQDVHVRLMRALFERSPQAVGLRVAGDVQSALALAPAIRPSLLLLDLNLPDGHGTALLGQLRGFAHLKDVPAIAVTAEPGFDIVRTGFEEVWRKPIHLERVLGRLAHWLPAAARATPEWSDRATVLEP
jgi:CheY-like chemotaxis protein